MTLHTNKQFDSELELIRTQLLQMGGLVESMINDAVAALVTGRTDDRWIRLTRRWTLVAWLFLRRRFPRIPSTTRRR